MDHLNSEHTPPHVPPGAILLAFLRLGTTAFGGPAMVAYIRQLVVTKKLWLSDDSFKDGVALCQSIPGATAMQAAAYCGYRTGGVSGAAAAYVAFGLPAFLLMLVFSVFYGKVHDFPVVVSVFAGLRAIVVAIVANATVNFGRTSLKNARDVFLALAMAAFLGFGGNPIIAIVLAVSIALIIYKNPSPAPPLAPALNLNRNRNLNLAFQYIHGLKSEIKSKIKSKQGICRYRNSLPLVISAVLGFVLAMTLLFLVDATLFHLAAIMLRIDVFAFGGGFASVPLMLHEIVDARHWLDGKTFMDGIALGQVTPGPIVITATFVGYHVAGVWGALVATLGIFTPSFFILVLAVPYLDRLQQSPVFRRGLRGALVCFVGLLLAVSVKFALAVPWSIPSVLIAGLVLIALRFEVDILWAVLAGALISAIAL